MLFRLNKYILFTLTTLLLAAFFVVDINKTNAAFDPAVTYAKPINGQLSADEWNNLKLDFLNTWGDTTAKGGIGIGINPRPVDFNGLLASSTITTFGGFIGSLNATNLSAGNFGANYSGGGGIWGFPYGKLGVSYSATQMQLGTATFAVNGSVGIGTVSPGAYKLNVVGDTYLNGDLIVGGRISGVKNKINTVTNNVGNPTVEEMALFQGQFSNKLRFIPANLQEESTNGVDWVTSTRASANQLADLMIGEGQATSVSVIPSVGVGNSGYYRLTWDTSKTGYVYLNSLYIYNSTNGNQVNFKVEAYHNVTGWKELVNGTVSNWPGHTYIPHSAIPFHPTGTSHYSLVRITFSMENAVYNNPFQLQAIEWFGGYPSGSRNVQSYDRYKNVTFPGAIKSLGSDNSSFVGNLGLGITNPTSKLEIHDRGLAPTTLRLVNDDSSSYMAIRPQSNGVSSFYSSNSLQFTAGQTLGSKIIFRGGQVEKLLMVIDQEGNVGINTSTPLYKLDVYGEVSFAGQVHGVAAPTQLTDAANKGYVDSIVMPSSTPIVGTQSGFWTAGAANSIYNNNLGSIGIGTTNPAGKLEISKDLNYAQSNSGQLYLSNAAGTGRLMLGFDNAKKFGFIEGVNFGTSYSPVILNPYSGNVGVGTTTPGSLLTIGNAFGLAAGGTMYSGATTTRYVDLSGVLPSSISVPNDIYSSSGNLKIAGTGNSYVMGNMGVGTTNPNEKLSVLSAGNSGLKIGSTGSSNYSGVLFEQYDGSNQVVPAAIGIASNGSGSTASKNLYFAVGSNLGLNNIVSVARMTINGITGNVGIGTTNPSEKLEVTGDVKGNNFIGNLYNFDVRANNLLPKNINNSFSSWFSTGGTSYVPTGLVHGSGFTVAGLSDPTRKRWQMVGDASINSGAQYDKWFLRNGSDSTWGTWRQIITDDGNGNVGIGTTSPAYKLDIAGEASFNSNQIHGVAAPTQLTDAANRGYVDTAFANLASSTNALNYWTANGNSIFNNNTANVGIGTNNPGSKLTVSGIDNKDSGPILNLSGTSVNQFESGRVRFTETTVAASPYYQGAFFHYNGAANVFNIGVHESANSEQASDINSIQIIRSTGDVNIGNGSLYSKYGSNVGVGVVSPAYPLQVKYNAGLSQLAFNRSDANPVGFIGVDSSSAFGLTNSSGSGDFYVKQNVGGLGNISTLIIKGNSGNVSIGTTTPAFKLDVSGEASFNSNQVHGVSAPTQLTDAANRGYVDTAFANLASSTNALNYWTANGNKIYNKNTGNVGIGTTNPLYPFTVVANPNSNVFSLSDGTRGLLLQTETISGGVAGLIGFYNGSYNNLEIRASAGGGSQLFLATNGKVGIGTTAPSEKLEVSGSALVSGNLTVGKPAALPITGLSMSGLFADPTSTSRGIFYVFSEDTAAKDKGGVLTFGGSYTGTTDTTFARIAGLKENNSSGQYGAYLGFYTRPQGQGTIEQMRISSLGNVGINTTTPGYKLDVAGESSFNSNQIHGVSAPTQLTDAANRGYVDTAFANLASSTNALNYWTANGNSIFNNNTANVGIGTADPSEKLEIVGKLKIGNNTISGENFNFESDSGSGMKIQTANGYLNITPLNTGWVHFYTDRSAVIFNKPIYNIGGGGFSSYSNENLLLKTGGTTRITANYNNGNVGIGTITPAYKLDVAGEASFNANQVHGVSAPAQLTDAANKSYVDTNTFWAGSLTGNAYNINSGNIGIGTNNPAGKLVVKGNMSDLLVLSKSSTTNGDGPEILFHTTTDPYTGDNHVSSKIKGIRMGGGADGDLAFYTRTSNAITEKVRINSLGRLGIGKTAPSYMLDVVGEASFNASQVHGVSAPTQLTDAANRGYVDTAVTNVIASTSALNYWTANGNKIFNNNAGNVGIGTSNPSEKFEVFGGALKINSSAGQLQSIKFANNGEATWQIGNRPANNNNLYFSSGINTEEGAVIASNAKLTIQTSGNVGIGTTNPGATLDVSGTFKVSGLSTLNSNLEFTQSASSRNIGVVGTYSPNSLASIWAMSSSHQLTSNGGPGNLYGLSYSYEPNYAGVGTNAGAASGLGHQMQWRAGGITQTAIGSGIWTRGGYTQYGTTLNYFGGNTGFGVTSPAYKLDVSGEANFNANQVHGVSAPTQLTDAANRGYVDTTVSSYNDNLYIGGRNLFKSTQVISYTSGGAIIDRLNNGFQASPNWDSSLFYTIEDLFPENGTYTISGYFSQSFEQGRNCSIFLGETLLGNTNSLNNVKKYFEYTVNITDISTQKLKFQFTGGSLTRISDLQVQLGNKATAWAPAPEDKQDVLWQTNGNNIFNKNLGNIGVGTTVPSEKLDILGNLRLSNVQSGSGLYGWSGNNTQQVFSLTRQDSVELGSLSISSYGGIGLTANKLTSPSSNDYHLFVNKNGNVGIGTTTPNAKLTVSGGNIFVTDAQITSLTPNAVITKAYLDSSLTGSGASLWATSTSGTYNVGLGNVGIGITSPSTKLEVLTGAGASSSGQTALQLDGIISWATVGSGPELSFYAQNVSRKLAGIRAYAYASQLVGLSFDVGYGNTASKLFIDNSGNIGVSTTSPFYKLDVAGEANFNGNQLHGVASPTQLTDAANRAYVDTAVTNVIASTSALNYWTANGDKIYSNNAGNVGVGTNNPLDKLNIKNTGASYISISDPTTGNAVSPNFMGINFRGYSDAVVSSIEGIGRASSYHGGGLRFNVKEDVSGGGLIERMRIERSGNIGIGTDSPTSKLDIKVSGDGDKWLTLSSSGISKLWMEQFTAGSAPDFKLMNNAGEIARIYEHSIGIGLSSVGIGSYQGYMAPANSLVVSGSLGIGMTNPGYKLDVAGEGNFSGQVHGVSTPTQLTDVANRAYVDTNTFWSGTLTGNISNLNAGNAGIGTTNPLGKVGISQNMSSYSTAFTSPHLALTAGNNVDTTGFVGITYGASSSPNYGWSSGALRSTNGQSDFVWKYHNNTAAGVEIMRLSGAGVLSGVSLTGTVSAANVSNGKFGDNTAGGIYSFPGNVGIGITNPGGRLDVNGGALRLSSGAYLDINRSSSSASGISWYSQTYNAWADYMASPGANMGPKGNLTAPSGVLVNGWALRSFIENANGFGWTFESELNSSTAPKVKFEIRSNDGSFHSYGDGFIDGAVGIGTTAPGLFKLKVVGNAAITGTLQTMTGSDFAEEFTVSYPIEAGTVVVMGDLGYKSVKACSQKYDTTVVGIVSDDPSIIAGKVDSKHKAVVAMMGVVKVKVTDVNGKIKKGTLLTTSSIPGYAMKSSEFTPGTMIGKALEDLSGSRGEIKVLVNLQ